MRIWLNPSSFLTPLASMGIYVFKKGVLTQLLQGDKTVNDFGGEIIPRVRLPIGCWCAGQQGRYRHRGGAAHTPCPALAVLVAGVPLRAAVAPTPPWVTGHCTCAHVRNCSQPALTNPPPLARPQAAKDLNVKAYLFDDYWEDIGTIKSFFEENLKLARHVGVVAQLCGGGGGRW